MDELLKAIIAAGEELSADYSWGVDEAGTPNGRPEPDGVFCTVIYKHLQPLLGDEWKKARIAALRAELEELEKDEEAPGWKSECMEMIRAGRVIDAIKHCRSINNWGLYESKIAIDKLRAGLL